MTPVDMLVSAKVDVMIPGASVAVHPNRKIRSMIRVVGEGFH